MHLHLCYTGALYSSSSAEQCTELDIQAWNNVNLVRLAEKIKSPLVL